MNPAWLPWRRMVAVWLPAVLLAGLTAALYLWQTSESVGRAAQITQRRATLEAEIERLERVRATVAGEREAVANAERELSRLNDEVFRSLDVRLTAIMREVGDAAREAGLRPKAFAYSAKEERSLAQTRFAVTFAVEGEYPQIRQLLGRLQASPEFLVVDSIAFSGESDSMTRQLSIAIRISTVLGEATAEQIQRLTGGIGAVAVEAGDGDLAG